MATEFVDISDILKGYAWACEIAFDAPMFLPGTAIAAQIRRVPLDAEALGALSTGAGTIAVLDDRTIAVTIPGAMSRDWVATRVRIDFVRTDPQPPEHLGVELDIAAVQPQTRGL